METSPRVTVQTQGISGIQCSVLDSPLPQNLRPEAWDDLNNSVCMARAFLHLGLNPMVIMLETSLDCILSKKLVWTLKCTNGKSYKK